MRCVYCGTFCESPSRVSGNHFCLYARKMVSAGDPICNEFSITSNFRCKRNGCQLSVPMCSARQINTSGIYPECNHCSQKREILEIKRFAGMKKRNNIGHIADTPFIPPPEILPVAIRSKIIRRAL